MIVVSKSVRFRIVSNDGTSRKLMKSTIQENSLLACPLLSHAQGLKLVFGARPLSLIFSNQCKTEMILTAAVTSVILLVP